jgi:FkbM family methyltransferase
MTVQLWLMHFPKAEILVVEPDAGNCEVLRKNIGAAKNVTVVQAGIGAKSRQAYLDTGKSECGFRVVELPGQHAERIPIKTMEELLSECHIQTDIDFLKCDIEGSERELFSDCRSWIRQVRNLSIEVHDDYTKDCLLEDLRRNGAKFVVAAENNAKNILLLQQHK